MLAIELARVVENVNVNPRNLDEDLSQDLVHLFLGGHELADALLVLLLLLALEIGASHCLVLFHLLLSRFV